MPIECMDTAYEWIKLLSSHTQRMATLWNFQIVVSIGIIGFVMTDIPLKSQKIINLLLLTILFIAFAVYNGISIKTTQERRNFAWDIVRMESSKCLKIENSCSWPIKTNANSSPKGLEKLVKTKWNYICELGPSKPHEIVWVLIGFDLAVVILIWIIPFLGKLSPGDKNDFEGPTAVQPPVAGEKTS